MKNILCVLALSVLAFSQQPDEWAPVAKTLGRSGKLQDGIYKVSFPRTDLKVFIGHTQVEAAAGLGSWMAFRKSGETTIADGDLVLVADEVNPAISALQSGGIEISAIHNHLIGEKPQITYVHFFGKGETVALATALSDALSKTRTPIAAAKAEPHPLADQGSIEKILGKTGTVNGNVLAFSYPRSLEIHMHQQVLPPAMGMATAINFQPSAKGIAATGDFVLLESEVQTVVQSLRRSDIQVTAMHNHLLDDEPRMVFVHFWAEGPAEKVAHGLRAALDTLASK